MRKWRPGYICKYIIPEVSGNLKSLEIILNRVLPLRKFKGQEDVLIMLGGFIDGDEDGCNVIETLITLKKEYEERIILLRGDHEERMLNSILGTEKDFQYWIENGGASTIEGYIKLAGLKEPGASLPQTRLKDIIPKHHIEFLQSLPYSYEIEDYFFIHGGFNSKVGLKDTANSTYAFDYSSNKIYKKSWGKEDEILVEKTVVACHNSSKEPVIYQNYMMLGELAPKALICIDINSMESVKVKRNKSRIYRTHIKTYG